MSDQSDDAVAKADAVLAGVTEGPWKWSGSYLQGGTGGYDEVIAPGPVKCMSYCYGGSSVIESESQRDREFIAAARTLVPELRDEVVRLRDQLADAERLLRNPQTVAAVERAERDIDNATTVDVEPRSIRRIDGVCYVPLKRLNDSRAEIERLTEQLIDARIAHINTVMALRNYQSYPPNQRYYCAGMTPEDFAAYLADPRGFVRQQIKDEISDAGREAYRDDARTILATIRERHAIIELPEPDYYQAASIDENGYVEWNYPHGSVAVTDDGTVMWGMWHFTDASRLRRAAAALLAAAQIGRP